MLALLNFRSSLRQVVFCVSFSENLDQAMSCIDENHWIHDLTHLLLIAADVLVRSHVMTAVEMRDHPFLFPFTRHTAFSLAFFTDTACFPECDARRMASRRAWESIYIWLFSEQPP